MNLAERTMWETIRRAFLMVAKAIEVGLGMKVKK